jgi:hypothetical protein
MGGEAFDYVFLPFNTDIRLGQWFIARASTASISAIVLPPSRSNWPSAQRYSIATFSPSM